ncbi:MAG: hypothetical protein PHX34_00955 [Candidatus Shapirobacteria bacterium]|nr:hypothetical protein [Candidatus Shapirobacteria bacterium]
MAVKKEISLLPETENPNSFGAKFFKWLTTVGRWVIILTELIVISAFISRFWLDRKNSDLSETVRQQEAILNSTKYFETEYASFQERLKTIKDFYSNQPEYNQQLLSLINSTPNNLIYDNLSIQKDSESNQTVAMASLIAINEDSIVNFISNLMLNPDIKTVNINKIEKKPKENSYTVSISVIFI